MDKIFSLFTAKKNLCTVFNKVHIKDGFAYATDNFKLIKLEIDTVDAGKLVALETLGKLELTKKEDDDFPDVERVMPSNETICSSYVSIKLSPTHFAAVAEAMKRMDKNGIGEMTISIPKDFAKPVVFKNKKATALLMPILK